MTRGRSNGVPVTIWVEKPGSRAPRTFFASITSSGILVQKTGKPDFLTIDVSFDCTIKPNGSTIALQNVCLCEVGPEWLDTVPCDTRPASRELQSSYWLDVSRISDDARESLRQYALSQGLHVGWLNPLPQPRVPAIESGPHADNAPSREGGERGNEMLPRAKPEKVLWRLASEGEDRNKEADLLFCWDNKQLVLFVVSGKQQMIGSELIITIEDEEIKSVCGKFGRSCGLQGFSFIPSELGEDERSVIKGWWVSGEEVFGLELPDGKFYVGLSYGDGGSMHHYPACVAGSSGDAIEVEMTDRAPGNVGDTWTIALGGGSFRAAVLDRDESSMPMKMVLGFGGLGNRQRDRLEQAVADAGGNLRMPRLPSSPAPAAPPRRPIEEYKGRAGGDTRLSEVWPRPAPPPPPIGRDEEKTPTEAPPSLPAMPAPDEAPTEQALRMGGSAAVPPPIPGVMAGRNEGTGMANVAAILGVSLPPAPPRNDTAPPSTQVSVTGVESDKKKAGRDETHPPRPADGSKSSTRAAGGGKGEKKMDAEARPEKDITINITRGGLAKWFPRIILFVIAVGIGLAFGWVYAIAAIGIWVFRTQIIQKIEENETLGPWLEKAFVYKAKTAKFASSAWSGFWTIARFCLKWLSLAALVLLTATVVVLGCETLVGIPSAQKQGETVRNGIVSVATTVGSGLYNGAAWTATKVAEQFTSDDEKKTEAPAKVEAAPPKPVAKAEPATAIAPSAPPPAVKAPPPAPVPDPASTKKVDLPAKPTSPAQCFSGTATLAEKEACCDRLEVGSDWKKVIECKKAVSE